MNRFSLILIGSLGTAVAAAGVASAVAAPSAGSPPNGAATASSADRKADKCSPVAPTTPEIMAAIGYVDDPHRYDDFPSSAAALKKQLDAHNASAVINLALGSPAAMTPAQVQFRDFMDVRNDLADPAFPVDREPVIASFLADLASSGTAVKAVGTQQTLRGCSGTGYTVDGAASPTPGDAELAQRGTLDDGSRWPQVLVFDSAGHYLGLSTASYPSEQH